ncbi:MAG: hypothetical protein HC896_07995 [Bacteroidales bacterium]|nr:hypothetical protein [Bacteroidales bacterium]
MNTNLTLQTKEQLYKNSYNQLYFKEIELSELSSFTRFVYRQYNLHFHKGEEKPNFKEFSAMLEEDHALFNSSKYIVLTSNRMGVIATSRISLKKQGIVFPIEKSL